MQAAKTYLERKFEEFAGADLDTLIRHGLQVRGRKPLMRLRSVRMSCM